MTEPPDVELLEDLGRSFWFPLRRRSSPLLSLGCWITTLRGEWERLRLLYFRLARVPSAAPAKPAPTTFPNPLAFLDLRSLDLESELDPELDPELNPELNPECRRAIL